jgi:hypothetical protein
VKLLYEGRCPFLRRYSVGGRWTIWTCNFSRLIVVEKSRNTLRQNQTRCNVVEHKSRLTDLESDQGLRRQTPESNRLRHDKDLVRLVCAKTGVSLWSCKQCALSGIGSVLLRLCSYHKLSTWRWGMAAGSRSDERNLKKYLSTVMMTARGLLKFCGKT